MNTDEKVEDIIQHFGQRPTSCRVGQSAAVGKDFLEHHGVRGQKWGVRRKSRNKGGPGGPPQNPSKLAAQGKPNSLNRAGRKAAKADAKAAKAEAKGGGKKSDAKKTKAPKPLTDVQLKESINRMQLEKQYNQLTSERALASRTNGQKFVAKLKSDAADVAWTQGKNLGNALVKQELEKQFGVSFGGQGGGKNKNKNKDTSTTELFNDLGKKANSGNKAASAPKQAKPGKQAKARAANAQKLSKMNVKASKSIAANAQRLSQLKPIKPASDSARISKLTNVKPIF